MFESTEGRGANSKPCYVGQASNRITILSVLGAGTAAEPRHKLVHTGAWEGQGTEQACEDEGPRVPWFREAALQHRLPTHPSGRPVAARQLAGSARVRQGGDLAGC